ncbi:MAG: sigma-70 family RNA polymerase sigma factor [Alphaproteobacteria bacterium]|nr:sigma-70 family RNA polymerase sigma factor [Alphaproteobacteria bacterium]
MFGASDKAIEEAIPRLRRYARALCRDAAEADDLVQDTLERAWSRMHLFRREGNMRAWLFTILHNLNANRVRAIKTRPALTTLADWEASGAIRPTQEEGVQLRGVAKALEHLPEEQKTVLLLVGLEDMTYDQVAKILDVPLGTVMSRLSRARERLRRLTSGAEAPAETAREGERP